MNKLNKLNLFKKKDNKDELEILTFLENKFSIIDNKLEKQIYGILKNKQIKELHNINYAIENLKNIYLIEKKKLEELLKIKNNVGNYIKSNENNYINKLKKKVNPDFLCNICYDNTCDIVLNPCGHIFCSKCYNNNKLCFICRKPTYSCIKIFHN